MEWLKGQVGKQEEEIKIEEVPSEVPQDFQLNEDDNVNARFVSPMKYDELGAESKDLMLETQEFSEGLIISFQKPIVYPPETPPPPQGPGPHKNYQAALLEKFTLNKPNSSNAQIGLQASFNNTDVMVCNYNTQTGFSGILARQFGNFDCVAQWMQHQFATGFYANSDYKTESSVSSFTFIRDQQWSISHLQSLWKGAYLGAKMRYEMGANKTRLALGARWASQKKDVVWSGEVEETGGFKVSLMKKVLPDTSVCCVYERTAAMGPQQPEGSSLWLGFGKEYLNTIKVKLALNTMMTIKASIDGWVIGRVMKGSYSCVYDPQKRNLKHGIQLDM